MKPAAFAPGQLVEYLSSTHNVWMPATVLQVVDGGYRIDLKPDAVIAIEKLRPRVCDAKQNQAQMMQWMFADAGNNLLGIAVARRDPLRWSKLLAPDALAKDIEEHMEKKPQDGSRPILISARDGSLEKELPTLEEAVQWLRSDGVQSNTQAAELRIPPNVHADWEDMVLYEGKDSFDAPYKLLSDISSVSQAKTGLKTGKIPNDADFFIVFSKSAEHWFLLYREPYTADVVKKMIKGAGGGSSTQPMSGGTTKSTEPRKSLEPRKSVEPRKSLDPSRLVPSGSEDNEILYITIKRVELARVFATFRKSQDLYVQVFFQSADSKEISECGRTCVIPGCDTVAEWEDETFEMTARGGRLTMEVSAEKTFWQDAFCGECAFDVEQMWQRLSKQPSHEETLQLRKRSEPTGNLTLLFESTQVITTDGDRKEVKLKGAAEEAKKKPNSDVDLEKLLKDPATLDEKLGDLFSQIAKPMGERKVLNIENLGDVQLQLSNLVGISLKLDELSDLFWRYSVNETATLGESEAMSFLRGIVMRCRNAAHPETQHQLKVPEMQVEDAYTLGTKLGSGAFGVVWSATNNRTGQSIVLKSHAKGNEQTPVEEINKEFEMMLELRHPKIARYYDIFQDSTHVYIVSEPYKGGDLSGLVEIAAEQGISVTEEWLARLVQQIATGMHYLHGQGIIHCDLKAENVMVVNHEDLENPQLVVIDFGLAGSFSSPQQHGGGTPGYMPPEVWNQQLWTPRGDVFSFGSLIFTMVTGENPFLVGAKTLDDVQRLTLTTEPALDFGSIELREITSAMLLKDFRNRPTMDRILQCRWFVGTGVDHKVGDDVLKKLASKTRQTKLRKALLMEVASKENLAHLTELNQLFMDIDKNNDGSLSVKEVRDALRSFNWTEEDIQKLLDCLLDSADDDAEVSYEEFMVNLMSATGNEENALLERIFREMDKTGRGTLDLNDIEELLKLERVRQVLGGRDAASLLKMMDSDGDNFVTLEEFKAVMCGVSTSQLSSTSIRLPKQRPPVHDSILRTFRPVPRQSAGMQYSKSQPVDYYSTTHNQWIRTTIAEVDPAKGVTVSVKIGVWLTGEELKNRVKPVSEMETIQES